jgi:hypothetical protein
MVSIDCCWDRAGFEQSSMRPPQLFHSKKNLLRHFITTSTNRNCAITDVPMVLDKMADSRLKWNVDHDYSSWARLK